MSALALFFLGVSLLELRLWTQGFQASIVDTEARWIAERQRASHLGERALILVGASRIQLGIDLDVARRVSALEPVQLAVDGSSFMPILDGLARDSRVSATILVDVTEGLVKPRDAIDGALGYQRAFERAESVHGTVDARWTEARLDDFVRAHLRSYADGARPATSLLDRALARRPTPQYLRTMTDRSRLADYARVDMPSFYYQRVVRNLTATLGPLQFRNDHSIDQQLQAMIETVVAEPVEPFLEGAARLEGMIATIQRNGGRVMLVAFPTCGMVRQIAERRFPRAKFWDRLDAVGSDRILHFSDVPALAAFDCPDGSHLDYRDRARFTATLIKELGLVP